MSNSFECVGKLTAVGTLAALATALTQTFGLSDFTHVAVLGSWAGFLVSVFWAARV